MSPITQLLAAATLALASLTPTLAAATYNFDINYLNDVNPDGLYPRRVITVNNKWPPPLVLAKVNETLSINVKNSLPVPTSLHSHGLFFNKTNWLDGAPGVTQCGIPTGSEFKYEYTPAQHGTFWYHAHNRGQYVDGFRGPLIIQAAQEAYKYDHEYVVILHDWYHKEYEEIYVDYGGVRNPTGVEPPPDNTIILVHNLSDYVDKISFLPGKTYRLRFINMSGFAMFHVSLGGHSMDVIEVDGVDTERKTTNGFWVSVASRWSVLVDTKNATDANYNMNVIVDNSMFVIEPPSLKLNVTHPIEYSPTATLNETVQPYEELNEMELSPLVPLAAPEPDQELTLEITLATLADGGNHGLFNGMTYTHQKVPTILTAMTTGANATNPTVYGETNSYLFERNKMVQVVINNNDGGSHPFHLHGHNFAIVYRSAQDAGVYDPITTPLTSIPANPVRRDIIQVPKFGHAIIRFRADNPGVWLFHCHIQWHMDSGLAATFVVAPDAMQAEQNIPQFVTDQCKTLGLGVEGNAAGKMGESVGDLTGANVGPGNIDMGWTAKGKGALAGCVIAALVGLGTVVWFARE
ncbi:Cupredoxin [Fimicolochytrium jonesii]|uniref:Cupredoxin n=1 Tax=Fimicolochytrium jonesii TaxID=1396493 RepID=UPI0022FE4B04|nr:Cupredoxin [Fimicolochytrium jonesii]KAI8816604.1 Cupredoxin [Fimicolochytrium jonesii]